MSRLSLHWLVTCTTCAFLLASCGGSGGATATVQPPPPLRRLIFSDLGVVGSLGASQGQGDMITLSVAGVPDAPEGILALQAAFSVSRTGYAGLFFQAGSLNGNASEDLAQFLPSGKLAFWIKSTVDVEVGLRSKNITPGTELSKIWIQQGGYGTLDGTWKQIAIPLSDFQRMESRLMFDQIQVLFVASAVGQRYGSAVTGMFELDDIRWQGE